MRHLYALTIHAFRNRWKGRVPAGRMVIVLGLFLGIWLFLGTICNTLYSMRSLCMYATSFNLPQRYFHQLQHYQTISKHHVPANRCCCTKRWSFSHPSCDCCFDFVLFFSTGLKNAVLAGGDVWKVVLKGMSEDVGCCSSAAPTLSSLIH